MKVGSDLPIDYPLRRRDEWNASTRKQNKRRRIQPILTFAISTILSILFLFPVLWLFSNAFKKREDIFGSPFEIIPLNPTFQNFIDIFVLAPFARYMLNSFIVATTITVVSLLFHSMAGYALARLRFPGRDILFITIISTMMIPFSVRMVPLFIITQWFGWLDSYAGLIIPPLFHAYGIFFLRQFYLTIPRELEEAAIIDGCSLVGVWYYIFVPLSKPVLLILGVLFFLANYNDFIWPLIITNSEEIRVAQVGLAYFSFARGSHWNLIMTGATVTALPTIVIFFLMQRHLVEGIKITGIKG